MTTRMSLTMTAKKRPIAAENPEPTGLSLHTGYEKSRGLLYHYTSIDGFLGILDSDCIRATHIRYLNDSREFVDALEHMGGLIDHLVIEFDRCKADLSRTIASAGHQFSGEFDRLRDSLRAGLGEFIHSISSPLSGRSGAYVVSFTDDSAAKSTAGGESGDRLSQWRAYGGLGRGVSLGFDQNTLYGEEPGKSWQIGGRIAYLLNCLYEENDKRSALKSAADILVPSFRKFWGTSGPTPGNSHKNEASLAEFRRNALLGWVINASTFKDPAFSEEKEWRVVILGPGREPSKGRKKMLDSSVKFRSGPMGVTPYVQFPLGLSSRNSPLRRIVVGPTPHMEESVTAVEMVLEDRGIKIRKEGCQAGIEVLPSRIPYRNW